MTPPAPTPDAGSPAPPSAPPAPARARPGAIGFAAAGLALFALALISEYRLRAGVSASVAELGALGAMAALLVERSRPRVPRATWTAWLLVGLLTAWLVLRAVVFRTTRASDTESAFSHVRDTVVPLLVVLLARSRVRLRARERRLVAAAIVAMGLGAAALGVSQFFRGGPYLFEGIEVTRFKTQSAQGYWLAKLLHLEVRTLARGLYGFSISYAVALVLPAVVAFALALEGRALRRAAALAAALAIYAGIYLSFARSVIYVVPVAWALAALAVAGWLRPWMCAGIVAGYLTVAFALPLLHLGDVSSADVRTLDSRVGSVLDCLQHVRRDPTVLLWGSPVSFWREWYGLMPHNWLATALVYDGLLGATLRLGSWLALFAVLFPVLRAPRPRARPGSEPAPPPPRWLRAGLGASPLAAGLWCGAFAVLFVVGETEPYVGISQYLPVACALALLAAMPDEATRRAPRLLVLEQPAQA